MGYNKQAGEQLPAADLNAFYASAGLYAASSQGDDGYEITVPVTPNDYDAGDTYHFKADVANTGAATLDVNGLGVKTIKKNGNVDLVTGDIKAGQIVHVVYDGTYFQLTSAVTVPNIFQQQVPVGDLISSAILFGSNASGSVFYVYWGGSDDILQRFERDSLTGQYFRTHAVGPTTFQMGDGGGIVVIGSYIYLIADSSGSNIIGARFSADDLTGEAALTLPSVASTNKVAVWTDGVDIYVISDASDTTSRRWTISGTTLSAAATATVSNSLVSEFKSSMWDGVSAFLIGASGNNYRIRKLTAIDGSATATTDKYYSQFNNGEDGKFIINIDNSRCYIGHKTNMYNETDADWSVINLLPITKP